MSPRQTNARDAALRRLSRANRWLVAGSVALTGVFAEVAASAFPGKTVKASSAGGSKKAGIRASKTAAKPIQQPTQAPKASTTPEPTTTPESPTRESAPSEEAAPAKESAPTEESAPTKESAPAQESAPTQESAPVEQSAPTQESAPSPESSAPVVSGGS